MTVNTERIQIELWQGDEQLAHEPFVWAAVPSVGHAVEWTNTNTSQLMRGLVSRVTWCEGTRYAAGEYSGDPGYTSARVKVHMHYVGLATEV